MITESFESVEEISDALDELMSDAEYLGDAIDQMLREEGLSDDDCKRLEEMQRVVQAVNSARAQMFLS